MSRIGVHGAAGGLRESHLEEVYADSGMCDWSENMLLGMGLGCDSMGVKMV